MEREAQDATERLGQFEMRVEAAEAAPQTLERWNHRAEALAAWLLSEWQRESQREAA